MIENFGIGIDIADINGFRDVSFEKKTSFYNKIFSKNEIDYCLKFKDPYPHFAGKFAIKEAVIKSLNYKIKLIDIQTDHYNEKPIVRITNKDDIIFKVSLSHEKNIAVAVVISEIKSKTI